MDKMDRVLQIKEEVRNKVLQRLKRQTFNYQADDSMVRRQIELALDAVLRNQMEGGIDEGLRRFIIEEVVNAIFGLGPIDRLVNDPGVWEIMVNGPKEVFVEREGVMMKTDVLFEDEKQVHFFIERLLSPSGRRVTEFEPYIDARLPDGSRINVVRRPVASNGPILTIRKAKRNMMRMPDLIRQGTLNEDVAHFLKECTINHLNVIIAGGPGSGKTTLLNILARFIQDTERVITIEDTLELRMEGKHRVSLETRPATIEGKGQITIRDLVHNSLHMRPDRVIIGEVRGAEALDMLQCMNIGRVGSMTTLHANSALDALLRLETMAMMGGDNLSQELIRRQIVSAIDLVIMIDRFQDGSRRILAITEIVKNNEMEYSLEDIYTLKMRREGEVSLFSLRPTGHVPLFFEKFRESQPSQLEVLKSKLKKE